MSAAASKPSTPGGFIIHGDPRAYLQIVWRWKLLLLAILVTIPLATYLLTRRQPNVYQATTLLQIQPPQASVVAGLTSPSSTETPSGDATVAARLLTTTRIAGQAAKVLGLPASAARSLLSGVTATASADMSGFVTITAEDHDPPRAANVANAFATALVNERTRAAIQQLDISTGQLAGQLASLPADNPRRPEVAGELRGLRALRTSVAGAAQVVDPAVAPTAPISPRVGHSVLLALIAALLLGFGAVAAAESLDRRIREPEELERLTGLPMLSAIPTTAFGETELSPIDYEAFYMLRAGLTYFNIDRRLSSVLITSAAKGDGKTTVATNLGIALARAGNDVIVLDADLRRSTAASRLGAGMGPGLGGVLVGELHLEDALIDIETSDVSEGRLRVLPAGPPPPNPSELIGSQRMRELLAELAEQSDIVIVDSTPVLSVSDSLPLMNSVSGVVMIARIGSTSRDALARLQSVVEAAGGSALGVVATGTTLSGQHYGYGYTAAYAHPSGSEADNGAARTRRRQGRSGGRDRDDPEL